MSIATHTPPARTPPAAPAPIALRVPADVRLKVDPEGFAALCAANRDLRLERKSDGGLIAMVPVSSDGGERNAELIMQLAAWNKATGRGRVYDSSAGFTLPDGAILSPDASWIRGGRWEALSPEERRGFARIVPDFVAELRSSSDALKDVRAKMVEYLSHGVRLGWLIDPFTQTVEVYRPSREAETLAAPASLSGEDVLPGLVLDLKGILFD